MKNARCSVKHLSYEQVVEILWLRRFGGQTQQEVADQFKISRQCVSKLERGEVKRWRHLVSPPAGGKGE